MVSRKKNLLDAFKASAPEGRAMTERKKNPQTSAGGPFAPGKPSTQAAWGGASEPAPGTPKPSFAPKPKPEREGPSTLQRALGDRTVRFALVAFAVIVAGAYWLGRHSSTDDLTPAPGEALAAAPLAPGAMLRPGSDKVPAATGAELAKRNESAAKVGTSDDQQFLDKRNQCTVRVAQYDHNDAGKNLANKAYDYLRREGIPAIRPIVSGGAIVICAGYAKSTSELEQLVRRIQDLSGPDAKAGKKPFHDAYLVNIDPYVQR
jgi:hypothetical protein